MSVIAEPVTKYRTLPVVAQDAGERLDALRTFLRRHADLARLAIQMGCSRVFSEEAAERIVSEFRAARGKTA